MRLTDAQVASMRAHHRKDADVSWCRFDGAEWPCDASIVLDDLVEAREEIERLKKNADAGWVE